MLYLSLLAYEARNNEIFWGFVTEAIANGFKRAKIAVQDAETGSILRQKAASVGEQIRLERAKNAVLTRDRSDPFLSKEHNCPERAKNAVQAGWSSENAGTVYAPPSSRYRRTRRNLGTLFLV